ncbi:hypothetical protein ACLKA6_017063 [Drosophila palustris]
MLQISMKLKLKSESGDGLFGVNSKTVLSQESRETCCLMTMDNGHWTIIRSCIHNVDHISTGNINSNGT